MVNDKVIFGIDISKGSPKAKAAPKYAVAIRSNGHIEHHRMVSKYKLIRMIWQLKPDILAVDNIHELTSNRRDLVSFMRKLPQNTKLIQVTGGEHLEPLTNLARSRGLSFDRFDPNQEAEVCAILASMDVGAQVLVFEDKTFIKVSRARSLGRGGWSQNRYRRKVHGHVRQKTREIEDRLKTLNKERGINYSFSFAKGFGGYIRGVFLVDAPSSDIPFGSAKYGDVQVKVQQIERDAIQFRPLKQQKRKYLIVGIDPGTTTGLALLDLEGSLVKLHSGRDMSVSDIIEMITQYGRPLIIATDVQPMPGTVEKIRRSFNAIAGEPDGSLITEEKIKLAREYGYKNDHERDALGAASHVFRRYKNKFDQIYKRALPGIDVDEAIALVMKGDTIDSAFSKLTTQDISAKQELEQGCTTESDEKITELTETVKRQRETIDRLSTYLEEHKSEVKKHKHIISNHEKKIRSLKNGTYAQLRKTKEIRIREDRIQQLEKDIKEKDKKIEELSSLVDELRRVRSLEIRGHTVPVKVVPSFTREAIISIKEQYGLNPGDVLFFKDASGGGPATVNMLKQAGVKAVIFRGEMAHNAVEEFHKKELPFLDVRSVPVNYVDDIGVADPEDFNAAMERFIKESESRKMNEKEKLLGNLIEEYKSERRRGIE